MKRKQNFQTISWFWDIFQRNLIDMNPSYQRRSVWNQSFKDYFIDTVLLEYPSPAVFLYEDISPIGITNYAVVDGKQRLTTIFDFVQNVFPVYEGAELAALRGLYFTNLPDVTKRAFWSYQFTVEYLPSDDNSVINSIFDRINRNTARLTAQELRHARLNGEFITVAQNFAEKLEKQLPKGFPNITAASRRQMKDVEFAAGLLLLLEEGPKGYSVEQLDEAFVTRDSEWQNKDDVVERFDAVISHINMLLSENDKSLQNSRLRNQADFYSLVGAIDRISLHNAVIDYSLWRTYLTQFIELIDSDEHRRMFSYLKDYYEAARAASNDAGPRRARIEILENVLRGTY